MKLGSNFFNDFFACPQNVEKPGFLSPALAFHEFELISGSKRGRGDGYNLGRYGPGWKS